MLIDNGFSFYHPTFGELSEGDAFLLPDDSQEGEVFMVTDTIPIRDGTFCVNAVSLCDGTLFQMGPDDDVIPVSVKVVRA